MTGTAATGPAAAEKSDAGAPASPTSPFTPLVAIGGLESLHEVAGRSWAAVERISQEITANIKRIDPRLRSEAQADEARIVREDRRGKLQAQLAMIEDAASKLEAQRRHYEPAAVMRRAAAAKDPGADATIKLAYGWRLSRLPDAALLQEAIDQAMAGNLALLECVRVELQARGTQLPLSLSRELDAAFAAVQVPESSAALDLIDEAQVIALRAKLDTYAALGIELGVREKATIGHQIDAHEQAIRQRMAARETTRARAE